MADIHSDLPFVIINNLGTGQVFRLMIHLEISEQPQTGTGFSTYGLSNKANVATVPLF